MSYLDLSPTEEQCSEALGSGLGVSPTYFIKVFNQRGWGTQGTEKPLLGALRTSFAKRIKIILALIQETNG